MSVDTLFGLRTLKDAERENAKLPRRPAILERLPNFSLDARGMRGWGTIDHRASGHQASSVLSMDLNFSTARRRSEADGRRTPACP